MASYRKAVLYRLSLANTEVAHRAIDRWCRRRRIRIKDEVSDYSENQPSIARLLKTLAPKSVRVVVVPSMPELSADFRSLARLIVKITVEKRLTLIFHRERLILTRHHSAVQLLRQLDGYERAVRSIRGKRSALLSKLLARPFGRPKTITEATEREARELHRRGLGKAEIARRLGISRTAVHGVLRRTLTPS